VTPEVPAAKPPAAVAKPAREWDAKHPDGVTAFAVTPDGQFAVTAGRDGALRVWAVADGTLRAERKALLRNQAITLAVSPDGRRIYTATEYGTFNAWSLPDIDGAWSQPRDVVLTAVAASPDGKMVAVAGRARQGDQQRWVELAAADTGAAVLRFNVAGETRGLAFGPNAADLDVLLGNGGAVTVYDAKTGRELRHMGVRGYPSAFACGPDGVRVIAGTQDDGVQFLLPDGKYSLPRLHAGGTESLALSPDGKLLLSGGRDGTVKLWRVGGVWPGPLHEALATLAAGGKPVRGVALTADGKLALAAGDDGVVRVWEMTTP
jgi:WD40 repeat protein